MRNYHALFYSGGMSVYQYIGADLFSQLASY